MPPTPSPTTIVPGGDGALFSIGGAGSDELVLDDGILDHETKPTYSVTVRATDGGSLTYDETLTITVNDINETPSLYIECADRSDRRHPL